MDEIAVTVVDDLLTVVVFDDPTDKDVVIGKLIFIDPRESVDKRVHVYVKGEVKQFKYIIVPPEEEDEENTRDLDDFFDFNSRIAGEHLTYPIGFHRAIVGTCYSSEVGTRVIMDNSIIKHILTEGGGLSSDDADIYMLCNLQIMEHEGMCVFADFLEDE